MTIRSALIAIGIFFSHSGVSYADHELRKSVFESLGPTAWGMYILIPVPFIVLGIVGYLLSRAWRASSDGTPPSLN